MNERRNCERAPQGQGIIDDHRLVLSSSHSCILADKSNVAQLRDELPRVIVSAIIRECVCVVLASESCRYVWMRVCIHVYVCTYVYVCTERGRKEDDDAQVDISKRSRCTIEL